MMKYKIIENLDRQNRGFSFNKRNYFIFLIPFLSSFIVYEMYANFKNMYKNGRY